MFTPSYGPDFELCRDLSRSVLEFTADNVNHHIVVPRANLRRFEQLAGPRTHIHEVAEFLPRLIRRLPQMNFWLNLAHPYPPLRGWIAQQILKLAFTAQASADAVLTIDSDTVLIRPLSARMFVHDGTVRFYRKPGDINARLPRHVTWHEVSRTLLGLPPADPPFTDYISTPIALSPEIVRVLLKRVEIVGERAWPTTIGRCLHFSELTLYGVFVDALAGASARSFSSADPLCHSYWAPAPLDPAGLRTFLASVRPDDLAVMVPSKSDTPLTVRRDGIRELMQSLHRGGQV